MVFEILTAKKAAECIGSLIFDYVSTCLSGKVEGIWPRIRLYKTKKRIKKWCDAYLINHDGTILTTGRFVGFLKSHRIFDEIFSFSDGNTELISESLFIDNLLKKTKMGISGRLSVVDESVIKEFYIDLLLQFNSFWISELSDSERQIVHQISIQNAKVLQTIENFEVKFQTVLGKTDVLIGDRDAVGIFNVLNDRFWEGDFTFVQNVLPVIEGRNKSLETWIKISLDMAMATKVYGVNVSDIEKITLGLVKNDAVRKYILFSYLATDRNIYDVNNVDEVLKNIVKDICESEDGFIFEKTVDHKNHTDLVGLKIPDKYKSELWLAKRILIIYMARQPLANRSAAISELSENESDFLISLIVANQHILELASGIRGGNSAEAEKYFNSLWQKREDYIQLNENVQKLFFQACFMYALEFESCKLSEVLKLYENADANSEELQDLVILSKIELKEASYTDVLEYCRKKRCYSLLNNYYISLNDPVMVEKLIRENAKELLAEPLIFFDYIRALRLVGKTSDVNRLLDEKRELYKDYLEFWIERITAKEADEDIDYLESLWKSESYKALLPITEEIVADMLYKHGKYNVCIEIVCALETRNRAHEGIIRLKAASYMAIGNKIEAYNTLKILFDKGSRDTFTIYNYTIMSLELKRKISSEVEKSLELLDTSYSLLLLAKICEKNGNKKDALHLYTKSLLKNQGENDFAYGNYFGFTMLEKSDVEQINGIAENTTAYLKCSHSENEMCISICSRDLIPDEPYKWNDTIIITKETAIKNDFLRKHVNDSIIYDEKEYIVIDIIPFDCYLTRTCINKMVDKGYAKACQLPIEKDSDKLLQMFAKWLTENIDETKKVDVFDDYKNPNKIPLTLFGLSKFSKVTYEETVSAIIEDPTIILREDYHFEIENTWDYESKFVLSFSSLMLLFEVGVDASILSQGNVFISSSLLGELQEEKDKIIKEYDRDTVASIGVVEGKLFVSEADENIKKRQMKYAVDLLDYCRNIPILENENVIGSEIISDDMLLELFGVVDYDAVSLCKHKGYVLVGIELFLNGLASMPEMQFESSNVIEFLNSMVGNTATLLEYMIKMTQYKAINVINARVLKRIISSEDENVDELWVDFLNEIDKTRGPYRELLRTELSVVGKNIAETLSGPLNDRLKILTSLIMKLNSIKLAYRINAEGDLEVATYYEPYEDVADEE